MPESRNHEARAEQIIGVRFRLKASADEVVARLLEAVRRTDLSLLKVRGDGVRVYPFGGRNPAWGASSWRAELFWHSPALKLEWPLEDFLVRAELLLDSPAGLRLERGRGQRSPLIRGDQFCIAGVVQRRSKTRGRWKSMGWRVNWRS